MLGLDRAELKLCLLAGEARVAQVAVHPDLADRQACGDRLRRLGKLRGAATREDLDRYQFARGDRLAPGTTRVCSQGGVAVKSLPVILDATQGGRDERDRGPQRRREW